MLLSAPAATPLRTLTRLGLFCATIASLLFLEAAPVGARSYALRYTDAGFALDAVYGKTPIPLLTSIRYEADTAQGLAFRTAGIQNRHAIGPDTQIDFQLEGPSASQAAVSLLLKPQAGSIRTVWTIHVNNPDLSLDSGKSGFRLDYASPIQSAETVPAIRFVRPTGRLPYEVVGDTPYRDLEWQLREVTLADGRLVIATDWYDPDWIYGHQSARAANLSAGFPKDSPTQATYVLAFVPLPTGPTDVRSPACASDVAATAAGRPLSLTALCDRSGHLFAPGEDVRFTLRAHNVTPAAAQGLLRWTVWDYEGRSVAHGLRQLRVKPGASETIPVKIPKPHRGMLFLDAVLQTERHDWLDRTTFAILPKRPLSPPDPSSPFGLAGIIGDPRHYPDQKTPDAALSLAQRIGVRWVRNGPSLQDAAAPSTDQEADTWQTLLAHYGMERHLQIKTGLPNEGQAETFNAQVRSALQRYQSRTSDIEFGNELNLAGVSPEAYVNQMLRPIAEATRQVAPKTQVMTMGLGGVDKKWLDGFVAAGGMSLVDVLSIHPGCQPRAPEYWDGSRGWFFRPQVLDALQAASGAGGKQVWITEAYAPTSPERSQTDVRTAADYLVRTYLVSLALGIKVIEWYQLQDGVWFAQRPNPADSEYNYGIVYTDLTPKSGYVAYGVMTENLTEARYRERLDLGAEDLYGLRFDRPGGAIDVLWSYREKHETDLPWWPPEKYKNDSRHPGEPWQNRWHRPVPVKLPAVDTVTVTDIMGNSRTIKPINGSISLKLTGSPVYVTGLGHLPGRANLW